MGLRILVVDDEDSVRSFICRALDKTGHEIVQASCAEDALQESRRQAFALVLTDIDLGPMSGIELLREVKGLDAETLVCVMTDNASLETAMTALRSGAYDYLTKPFEDPDLISALVNRATDKIRLVSDNHRLLEQLRKKADELEAVNRKLKGVAERDGLTGLYNHRFFRSALENELRRSSRHRRQFSLLFLDLDHFKNYNDSNGHLAGDAVLRQLALLLEENNRSTSTVARYGGEEFVVLIPETDEAGGRLLAERIRSLVEQYPFEGRAKQPEGKVTVSVGVSSYPEDGAEATVLIEHADRALYAAKNGGRNKVCSWQECAQPG